MINPVQNFLKSIFETKFMIYHCFCCWIEINWSKFNFSIWLVFFNITFSVIWYLKPFVSFKRSLNKSLIIDLLTSNYLIGSFFSTISTLWLIAYPLNAWFVLLRSVVHKKEVQKASQCFFKRLIFGFSMCLL